MSYIVAENLIKQYGSGEVAVTAVRGISFEIQSGEFIGIMGESGSGKSTLLSMMGALNTPTSGRYMVDKIDVYALAPEQRADFRREFLGFVFQGFYLLPYLTVLENVMLPMTTIKMRGKRKRALAEQALNCVGLAGKAGRLPSQISGGEQERVSIARAIVNEPPYPPGRRTDRKPRHKDQPGDYESLSEPELQWDNHHYGDPQPRVRSVCAEDFADFRWLHGGGSFL